MGNIGRRRDGASLGWRLRCALAALALAAGQALGLLAPTVAAAATAYTDGQTVYVDPTDTHVEAMYGNIHVVRGTGDLALCVEPGVRGQSGQRTAHNLVGKITNYKNGNTSRYWDQEGVTLAALAVDYYLNHSGLAYADAFGQAQLTLWHFAKWGDLNMGDAWLTAYVNANRSQYVGRAWLFETTADQSSATFWLVPATGKGKLRKFSGNTAMTDGNPCYSLAGAVYGVYLDDQCQQQNRVAELVTDEQGNTGDVELSPGTYFVKEEKASKGYALCGETHRLTVAAGQTSTVECAETPQNDPNLMKVQKVDSATGEAVAQGDATLAGAPRSRFGTRALPPS